MNAWSFNNEGLGWNEAEDTQQHMQNLYMKQHSTLGAADAHQCDCLEAGEVQCQKPRQMVRAKFWSLCNETEQFNLIP